MKSRLLAGLTGLGLALTLTGCTAAAAVAGSSASPASPAEASGTAVAASSTALQGAATTSASTTASGAAITAAEAQAIALAHAGLPEADVTMVRVHLDHDDGRQVYEVEFYSGNSEHDYDIDAASGEVLSYDTDIENYTAGSGQQADVVIDEATAKATALAKVPGAADADIRIRLDYDDGQLVYEGSIVYEEMKYEFEISAADGAVLEWSAESVYDD